MVVVPASRREPWPTKGTGAEGHPGAVCATVDAMGVIAWLVLGLVAGAVARLLVPGPHNLGCIGTAVLGILGSFVGGTLFNAATGDGWDLQPSGLLGAIFGGVALLVLGRLLAPRTG